VAIIEEFCMKMQARWFSSEPAQLPNEGQTPNLDLDLLNLDNDPASIARSEANILKWMEYLPEDCIARMIQMKWDITT
jgi:hypothetical protein